MSLSQIIESQVTRERHARELDDFEEWLEAEEEFESAPPTERWLRPPWCLDLPLQPETDLPSVILS
jgi:hypothetical protein